jgi:hypothetical protein
MTADHSIAASAPTLAGLRDGARLDPNVAALLAAISAAQYRLDQPVSIAAAIETAAMMALERDDAAAAADWLLDWLAGRVEAPAELTRQFQVLAERRPGGAISPIPLCLDDPANLGGMLGGAG